MPSIFSRIIAGEIPCTKVYEDEHCIAILDINPVEKGHTLLIPKQEIERLRQLPTDLACHCMSVTQQLMQAMIKQLPCDYVKVVVVGEEVPHCHTHLIPMRFNPGKDQTMRPKVSYQAGEAQQLADSIGRFFAK